MKVRPTDSKIADTKNEPFIRSAGMGSRQSSFIDALKDSETERRKEACENILKQIDTASEGLKKAATPETVKKYQKLIANFMKEAMSQSYELKEDMHWDREGNRKNYLLVKQINQSVEELMDAVMNQEKSQIDIVAKLDQIRGLLLDLYF